ncbi:hypothetical protein Dimus_000238 [Dionaea muscipula]
MRSPEKSRSYMKGGLEEGSDVKGVRAIKEEDLEGNERRHKSNKLRKNGSGEESDGWGGSGRSSDYRNVNRKRSGGSSRGYKDVEDQDVRKDMHSGLVEKNQEESTLEKLSIFYQDGELENRHYGGDKPGSWGHGRVEESDKNFSRKTALKLSDHEWSQSKERKRDEKDQDMDRDKTSDKDSRSLEKRESSRERGHGSSDHGKNPKRRLDESDVVKKTEESNSADKSELRSGKGPDSKRDNTRERVTSARPEFCDGKGKGLEYSSEKGKSYSRDESRVDPERTKSRSRSDAAEEDSKASPLTRDDRSGTERNEKYREQKTTSREPAEHQEKSFNLEDDVNTRTRVKNDKYIEQRSTCDDASEYREKSFNPEEDAKAWAGEKNDKYREQKMSSHDAAKIRGKSFNPEGHANTWIGEKNEKLVDDTTSRNPAENREKSFNPEEDGKARSGRKNEKCREQKTTSCDPAETQEKSSIQEEDGNTWTRDANEREVGHSTRSRSPEKSGRNRPEPENFEMDYDRSSVIKRKEPEKDAYKDERVKSRDDGWGDRNRDREGSRDNWKRRQPFSNDKDGDVVYDRDREWELPRRGRDRIDNERPLGRSGNRREGRSEAVKASSNTGISTENYDVIEIQPNFTRRNQGQVFDSKSGSQDEWAVPRDDWPRASAVGFAAPGESSKEWQLDEGAVMLDHNAWRDDADSQEEKTRGQKGVGHPSGGQSSSSGSQPPYGNHEPISLGRTGQQGVKGGRMGIGNRLRPAGRDNQHVNMPVPLFRSPFGPIGMPPPVPLQPLNPSMSPAPGPVPPGGFIPPFSPPIVWPGPRGVDLNMLPGVSSVSPGPPVQRFPPNMGTPPNPAMFFNQPGPGRGVTPIGSGPGFNAIVPVGRGQVNDRISGAWVPPKSGGPSGKAPSRGEQNDYSQNFVDTGMRPQNFIRELELTNVEDYPKLRELIQKKDEIVAKSAAAPMYYKCDLREFVLSSDFFGTKFDVILVDPPWEEYVHRAPGTDHTEYWTLEEIMNLKIEAIADTPSFIFLWVGDGVGLEQGRQCLKKWGFRRCEDICWVKTNKHTATPALRHDSHTLFQHSKEHCLMGIKGTVRRSTDGHIIHANIDTDVIIAEEPPYGSTAKPDDIYRIIEHFSLGRRRLELFGEDHNIRSGWLTVGRGLSSSNFNSEAYARNFTDKDGKIWQGGGGRNPPPEAPHLVVTTPDIESLRPKSPMKNQQQLQQQQSSASISLTTATSGNKRPPAGNSPQRPNAAFSLSQEAAASDALGPPWASPMDQALQGRDFGVVVHGDHIFDMYGGYNAPPPPPPMLRNGQYLDFESQGGMNPPM